MPRKIDFTLTTESVKIIEIAIRHDKNEKVRQRAVAIRQLHLGKPVKEVADLMLVTEVTIYGWWQRYQAEGVAGLANKKQKASRRKVTEAYLVKMEEALDKETRRLWL